MDKVGEISSVVKDHVQGLAVGEDEGLLDAPHVLLVRLSLPCVDWHADSGNSCGGVVLVGEGYYNPSSLTITTRIRLLR